MKHNIKLFYIELCYTEISTPSYIHNPNQFILIIVTRFQIHFKLSNLYLIIYVNKKIIIIHLFLKLVI